MILPNMFNPEPIDPVEHFRLCIERMIDIDPQPCTCDEIHEDLKLEAAERKADMGR